MKSRSHDPGGQQHALPSDVRGRAIFDADDSRYRYVLTRDWEKPGDRGLVVFVCLNPSAADKDNDDLTVRKCWKWARNWGCRSFVMLNLYAYRAMEQRRLGENGTDPVGWRNDDYIRRYVRSAERVIVAWGRRKRRDRERLKRMREILGSAPLFCLAKNKDGSPRHPRTARLVAWDDLEEWSW